MASPQWNARNPAVKRIIQELKEIQRDDNPDILAEALEDNIFEWHFVIRGAWETEFEGGIYHGRIIMPADYPFKPPAFVMLTPSGRFETGVKICLSISSYHPESWQPSWSVRSALVALIAFMQTPGSGAIGSLDHNKEVRKQMAIESRQAPPKHSNEARQAVICEMHQRMLDLEPVSMQLHKGEAAAAPPVKVVEEANAVSTPSIATPPQLEQPIVSSQPAPVPVETQVQENNTQQPPLPPPIMYTNNRPEHQPGLAETSWEDKGLTYIAVLLACIIVALLLRKIVLAMPAGPVEEHMVFDFSMEL